MPVDRRLSLLLIFVGCLFTLHLYPPLSVQAQTLPLSASPVSTILPAGATSVDLTVTSAAATDCRYALNSDLPFGSMTPFAQTGTTEHRGRINGLNPDPNVINQVIVRCEAYPNQPLTLRYRSLSQANPSFPRTGNLWGMGNFYNETTGRPDLARMARIDLWLGAGDFRPDEIRELRRLNPNVLVLTSYNAVELGLDGWQTPPPDDIWLRDIHGNRIEVWPGAYRVNMTRLDVAEYMARNAYQMMLDNDLMYDGIFIDNVFAQASWFTEEDIYGNPFLPDADGDGRQDDRAVLDAAWRRGLLHQLRLLRQLLPNALFSGHAQNINDPDMAEIFNSTSIGFDTVNVIEGRDNFGRMWARYRDWQTLARPPVGTMVESAVPYQIGYGYGFLPFDVISDSTLAFARDYYPYMRFGLAFTLMHDGYFAHEFGDTWHGNNWWYDELDHDLGYPTTPASWVYGEASGPNTLTNPGFESDGVWTSWVDTSSGNRATLTRANEAHSGTGAMRIDIAQSSGQDWQIGLFQEALNLTQATDYVISFWARADRRRSMTVNMQKGAPDWRDYGLYQTISLTTEWQQYTLHFTAVETASDARLGFLAGAATGSVWIDDVAMNTAAPNVLRREFQNGLVLLNASRQPQTIDVGSGYQRLTGAQAALYEYIVNDSDIGFTSSGNWANRTLDSGDWTALPPFYHAWGRTAHMGTGTATWDLRIPSADTYTITTWYAAAPEASGWNSAARYEVLDANGQVLASATLDQRTGGDHWHPLATVALQPGARVRLTCEGAPCSADAFHIRSAARFNDGSIVTSVTLAPMDGIVLARTSDSATPTPRPRVIGDVDGDGRVTLVDFSLLVQTFNRAAGDTGYDGRADLNTDARVTLTDFSLLAMHLTQDL